MQHEFEFIVIGAGAAGASAAYQLAKRGKSVLLLEQYAIGHDRGASQGHSRIFRFAYDSLDYAKMAMQSLVSWRNLEADAGLKLLTMTGGLDVGAAGAASLEATAQGMTNAGASFERLTSSELMQRFPQWHVPENWVALHSQDAGILNPTHCTEVIVGMARAHGAKVLEHTTVEKLELETNTVITSKGSFSADKIIVAAGAWLPELIPNLNLNLSITLESGVFFRPKNLEMFMPERFPLFIEHRVTNPEMARFDAAQAYGFPVYGLPGVKIGLHHSGDTVTASNRDFEVSTRTLETLQAWMLEHLPDAAGEIIHAKTCLYSNTNNHDFLIDWHSELAPQGSSDVLIASPCSGHGFKFAPFMGELLADMVMDQANAFQLERFGADSHLAESRA
jgi:sarcosine oxidase